MANSDPNAPLKEAASLLERTTVTQGTAYSMCQAVGYAQSLTTDTVSTQRKSELPL